VPHFSRGSHISRWMFCCPSRSSLCYDVASRGLFHFTVIPTVPQWAIFFRTSGPESASVPIRANPWLKIGAPEIADRRWGIRTSNIE